MSDTINLTYECFNCGPQVPCRLVVTRETVVPSECDALPTSRCVISGKNEADFKLVETADLKGTVDEVVADMESGVEEFKQSALLQSALENYSAMGIARRASTVLACCVAVLKGDYEPADDEHDAVLDAINAESLHNE